VGLAPIDARWSISGAKMPNDNSRPEERGILTAIVADTGSGWKILALRENASASDISPMSQAR